MKEKLVQTFALGLCLFTAGILCACSGDENSKKDSTESENSSQTVTADYTVTVDTSADASHGISDTLYGLFLEDINFAVDGGLYAELIKNRSFEYGTAAANEGMHGWVKSDDDLTFEIRDGSPDETCLNANNTHYAVITNSQDNERYEGIGNVGYLDGLAVTENETYYVSLYLKGLSYSGSVHLSLRDADGVTYAQAYIDNITDSWQKYETTLVPNSTVNKNLRLFIEITAGSAAVDMVSLMPAETYEGLPIRKDIGEYLEALNPSFIRFPGGCVIEGKDEESIYSWKDSIGNGLEFMINGEAAIGDAASRSQGKDIWSGTKQDPYYTTYGIGFYEYFELCEALDALAVPVLNAGMTCEVQSTNYKVYPLSSDEFKQAVQDALDLVEFCRGGADTEWGAVRIAMGHDEPFSLKYIAIGNEQWQSEYHAHYEKFVEAFEEAAKEDSELYGGIELIVANGTASGSKEGWNYVDGYPDSVTTLVDEHYYEAPDWFLTNTTRYDGYDRDSQAGVFLGEYAAQSNTLNAALAEAAYMTGLERNSDIVKLACYAPLFGNSKTNQWTPDMLFFSNDSVYGTVNYYVQLMFANNVGTDILPSVLEMDELSAESCLTGAVGLGSWMTSVSYDNLIVAANDSGDILYRSDFESGTTIKDDGWNCHEGDWSVKDGKLVQTNTADPFDTNTGDVIYIGDADWSNYTLTVDAKILGGSEGFLIPVCVQDTGNNIFWNIGGWGNTVSCLQIVSGNSKSGQISGTTKNLVLKKNQVYQLKVVVDDNNIKCYIDDALYIDYTQEVTASLYETASIDENGDIILKFVNSSEQTIDINAALNGVDMSGYSANASVLVLKGDSLNAINSFDEPEKMIPVESSLDVGGKFTYKAPAYSVSIIRIMRQ